MIQVQATKEEVKKVLNDMRLEYHSYSLRANVLACAITAVHNDKSQEYKRKIRK